MRWSICSDCSKRMPNRGPSAGAPATRAWLLPAAPSRRRAAKRGRGKSSGHIQLPPPRFHRRVDCRQAGISCPLSLSFPPGVYDLAHRTSVLSASFAAIALMLVSAFATPRAIAAQPSTPPKVLIIATGGTIASTGNYYHDRGGAMNKISAEALTRAVPGIDKVATLGLEQFSNVTSEKIGPTQWLALANRINAAFHDDADLAGVVVTHGTDTMEETAYFLDLTVAGDRPVIVTGSMRPADAIGADGPANLYNAVRAAAAPASRGRGTMVLMDDRLFAASEVTKTNTSRVE